MKQNKWEIWYDKGNKYRGRNTLDNQDYEIQVFDVLMFKGKGIWNTLDTHKRLLDIIGIEGYEVRYDY